MVLPENTSVWKTDAPVVWPDVPAEMTVTTLAEIEACPRRWALSAAQYPELWSGIGYPPRVQLSTLAGSVVHLALEVITRELVRAGCQSLEDPTAIQVLKDLGGYSNVVADCNSRVLERLSRSPRAKHLREFAARSLHSQLPDLRIRVQTMVGRLRLPRTGGSVQREGVPAKGRRPLTAGVFPEIELRAKQIGWKGKADLLVLSTDACEIVDFKAGSADDRHQFQIRVYALLWKRDAALNPRRRRADRLVLAYSNDEMVVTSPTDIELDELEGELVARGEAARQAVARQPPEARPDPSNCLNCGVRQLCDEYWTTETQRQFTDHVRDRRFSDMEVTIIRRHGPTSWVGSVECSPIAERGEAILLRGDNLPFALKLGQRLRVLSVYIGEPDKALFESELVAVVGAGREVFVVSK